jgi:hypothetical protein
MCLRLHLDEIISSGVNKLWPEAVVVEVDLGAGTARACRSHLPKIILKKNRDCYF